MTLPRKLYEAIRERDGFFCLFALPGCNGEGQVLDHRANRGMGGSVSLDHPANLVLCCSSCNSAKADAHAITLLDLEERGLWVRPAATHEKTLRRAIETPVVYLDGSRWYLVSATERISVEDAMGGA